MKNIKCHIKIIVATLLFLLGSASLIQVTAKAPTQVFGIATGTTLAGALVLASDHYITHCGLNKETPTRKGFIIFLKNCVSKYTNNQTRHLMASTETKMARAILAASFFGTITAGSFIYNQLITKPAAQAKLEQKQEQINFFRKAKITTLKKSTPEQQKARKEKLEKIAANLLAKNNKIKIQLSYKKLQAFAVNKKKSRPAPTTEQPKNEQPAVKETPKQESSAQQQSTAVTHDAANPTQFYEKLRVATVNSITSTLDEAIASDATKKQNIDQFYAELGAAAVNTITTELDKVTASNATERQNCAQFYAELGAETANIARTISTATKNKVQELGAATKHMAENVIGAVLSSFMPSARSLDMTEEDIAQANEEAKKQLEENTKKERLSKLAEERMEQELAEANDRYNFANNFEKSLVELMSKEQRSRIEAKQKETITTTSKNIPQPNNTNENTTTEEVKETRKENADFKKKPTQSTSSRWNLNLGAKTRSVGLFLATPVTGPLGLYKARQEKLAQEKAEKTRKEAEDLRLFQAAQQQQENEKCAKEQLEVERLQKIEAEKAEKTALKKLVNFRKNTKNKAKDPNTLDTREVTLVNALVSSLPRFEAEQKKLFDLRTQDQTTMNKDDKELLRILEKLFAPSALTTTTE